MSLYRCAACGSPNVVTDTQVGGIKYNYLKGAVGTVALGVGGAAAGITSEKQQVFKCPDCGTTLTYSMDAEMKNLIDFGVMSADARQNLKYCGIPVSWKFISSKYKNIEDGIANQEEKERASNIESICKQLEIDTSEEAQNSRNEFKDEYRKEYESLLPVFVEWGKSKNDVKIKQEEEKKKQISEMQDSIVKLEHEYSSLGIFKGARKKEIEKEINRLKNSVSYFEKRIGPVSGPFSNMSPEELGGDVQALLFSLAAYGPSTMSELRAREEIRNRGREKADNAQYWAVLARKLCDDQMLLTIKGYRRFAYFALPENYMPFIMDGKYVIEL